MARAIKAFKKIPIVVIAPTDRCNMRCVHCYFKVDDAAPNRELAVNHFLDMFNRSRLLSDAHVEISGGEPFLYPDLSRLILGILKLGHTIGITTNGSLPDKVEDLLSCIPEDLIGKIFFSVSIDGAEEVHSKIRGRQNPFENIIQSAKLAQKYGVATHVVCVVQKRNIDNLKELTDLVKTEGLTLHFAPLMAFPEAKIPYEEISMSLLENLEEPSDIKYVLSQGEFRISNCTAGSLGCYIDPYGKIYACVTGCFWTGYENDFLMGDITDYALDFDSLWISDRADSAREKVSRCPGCYNGCEIFREKLAGNFNTFIEPELVCSTCVLPNELFLADKKTVIFLPNGWYPVEQNGRWSGREATFCLNTKPGDVVSIELSNNRAVDAVIEITSRNIVIFKTKLLGFGDLQKLSFAVDKDTNSCYYTLRVNPVWRPVDDFPNSNDSRELGVFVKSISVKKQ